MLRCALFGHTITFQDSAERFFDLQYAGWTAQDQAKKKFLNWYDKCGNIENVLRGYKGFAQSVLNDLAIQPLFNSLRQYDIYDVSRDDYCASCADYTETEHALNFVAQQYTAIQNKREADAEYRAVRKASRGRWQGGGFGFSGAVKGAAMAGGMNLLSGMGHSVINAVGNAGSSMEASSAMRKLYTQAKTRQILFDALAADLFDVFFAHMDLINDHKPGYISDSFDPKRATALFENAKLFADKRRDLLIQALSLCPWNAELVRYIFVSYPEERREISAVAHRFHVDLTAVFEDLLTKEYPEEARGSEEAAQKSKAKILAIMAEYHIKESATLDRLENDCLERLCSGVESADKAACLALQERLRQYDALEKNKAPYLEQVGQRLTDIWKEELSAACAGCEQADEATCSKMKAAVQEHDAPEELKALFLDRLQQRVEEIWSAEDGALFEKLYLSTDITDSAAVTKTMEEIKRSARTSASEGYISALETCTEKDIRKARIFQRGIRPKLYAVIGCTFFLMAVSNFFLLHMGLLATILCVVASLVFLVLHTDLSDPWEKLTLKGKVFHPALTAGLPRRKKRISSFVIALLLAALLSFLGLAMDGSSPVSDPAETEEAVGNTVHDLEDEAPLPTPESEDPDELLARNRLEYMVTGADGNSYNRYLGSDYQVYWYYDYEVDEEGTEEFIALCPDKTNLASIFDCALSSGIDANGYIAAHSDDTGVNIASDPTTPEGTEESAPPPEFTREELSAVIASVLPSEIGAFRPGSGSVDTDGEPGYVRISQCELDSAVPAACDISVVTAEVLMYWTDSYGWELESIRFDGNARLGIEGDYTISSFGLTQSANVTIGPYATIDSDGSLVFQNVAIQCGYYMTETSLTVEVIDHPENMVATKESGSVYRGNTPDNKFSLYFDADMKPIFFAYDP